MTKCTASFFFAAAFFAALSSPELIAQKPSQQIPVIVNATDEGASGNQFFAVDTARTDAVKEIENVLRKSSDLLVTKSQSGNSAPVTIVVTVKNACMSTGADVYPDRPALAKEMFWSSTRKTR